MTAPDSHHSPLPSTGRGLVIVAHPDDEVIWCGGLILQHPGIDWTIIALCRGSDPDRRPRFDEASKALGASGIILDIDDSPTLKPLSIKGDVVHPLSQLLPSSYVTLCLTHGVKGEYGHQRHIDTHNAVRMMIQEGILCCKHHYFFSYRRIADGSIENVPDSDLYYPLNADTFEQKRTIIRDIYGFNETSFEWQACLDHESFDSHT